MEVNSGREQEVPMILKDFIETYKWPTMGVLRNMIFRKESNGLDGAFLKFGKRVLILPNTFFKLLKQNSDK